ncbi:MAG: substrate-binding domain-containing protein, partial [Oscillospiraceae bacterium]
TTKEAVTAMKTDIVLTNIAGDDHAIGYVSLGSLNENIKTIAIDGIVPNSETVKDGSYPIARPFNIATKLALTEVAQDFIDFIMSKEGQDVVAKSYIRVDEEAIAYNGKKPSGKIVVAGSSSVSPVMEKLKEAYEIVNPNATVEVQQSDSSAGMTAVLEGNCDIGMASRNLKDSEKENLNATAIALDGIGVIVNPNNPLTELSTEQVRGIFIGNILNWSELSAK